MTEVIVGESGICDTEEVAQLSRLERMLLFAVVSECERCISSEGEDCLESLRKINCPLFNIRQIYKINDIEIWKEMMK